MSMRSRSTGCGRCEDGQIIVATESNVVSALDSVPGADMEDKASALGAASSQLPCGNIDPDGITETPVIDPAAGMSISMR